MRKAAALTKGLAISGLILTIALVIAGCLECKSASKPSIVVVCAIVMVSMIALQLRYLFGTFLPSIWPAQVEASKRKDEPQLEKVVISQSTFANATISISLLASAIAWAIGAMSSVYPARIPLMFSIAGVVTVLLFNAASEVSTRVRVALARWAWISISVVISIVIVSAVVVYGLDVLREHPLIGLLCGLLNFAMAACGVYRSGYSENIYRKSSG